MSVRRESIHRWWMYIFICTCPRYSSYSVCIYEVRVYWWCNNIASSIISFSSNFYIIFIWWSFWSWWIRRTQRKKKIGIILPQQDIGGFKHLLLCCPQIKNHVSLQTIAASFILSYTKRDAEILPLGKFCVSSKNKFFLRHCVTNLD